MTKRDTVTITINREAAKALAKWSVTDDVWEMVELVRACEKTLKEDNERL